MSVTNAPRKLTVSTKNVLHYLIMIALMVIFYFIPSGNVITPYGMRPFRCFHRISLRLDFSWIIGSQYHRLLRSGFCRFRLFRGGILSLIR